MAYRIIFVLFLVSAIGILIFYQVQRESSLPANIKSRAAVPQNKSFIVKDEALILMEEGQQDQLESVLQLYNLKLVMPLGEWVHVRLKDRGSEEVIIGSDSKDAQENIALILALDAHSAVHSASLNYVQPDDSVTNSLPHDPLFSKQWHLSSERGMNLPGAWAITKGSNKVVLGLVDRNFVFTAEDLSLEHCRSRNYFYENILDYFPGRTDLLDQDKNLHGTNILSVVAPCTDNTLSLAGIDWYAQVFAVDSRADASLSARMFGLLWAAGIDPCTSSIAACPMNIHVQKNRHPANVINASFGFVPNSKIGPLYGPILDIVGQINRQGSIVVASAGNESSMSDRRLPGAASGVISVGSSNIKKQSSPFSNFGRSVDVLAPGENILGLDDKNLVQLNGTSFSSPMVAGIASLMLAANPNLAWKHVEYILKVTSSPLSCSDYCPATMPKKSRLTCQNYCCEGEKNFCARGIVNAKRAVEMAKLGIPKRPLIDVEDYFIPLSEQSSYRSVVRVKNWGAASGRVRLKQTDKYLKIFPTTFSIDAASETGIPATKDISIYYDHMPTAQTVISLVLQVASFERPEDFDDQIEAIVEIMPDIQIHQKRYFELLPKS